MCYNAQVSLNTFLLGMFAMYFQYDKKNPWILLFWFSFISVQLCEYFIWKNLHNVPKNRFYSQMTMLCILLQPVFAIKSAHLRHENKWLGAYVLFCVLSIMIFSPTPKRGPISVVASNKHLIWKWSMYPMWICMIWVFFLIAPMWYRNISVGLFTLLTLMISIWTYYRDGTWQSMWCWISTIGSFYVIWDGIYKPSCI